MGNGYRGKSVGGVRNEHTSLPDGAVPDGAVPDGDAFDKPGGVHGLQWRLRCVMDGF